MRIATLVLRLLLGLVFLVFGLNGFLHFIPQPPMPPGDAATLSTVLAHSGWMTFVSLLEVIASLMLLAGRYVPLGLTLLAPILVNILLFHTTLLRGNGIAPGLVCTFVEVFLIYVYRRSFRSLFDSKPEPA